MPATTTLNPREAVEQLLEQIVERLTKATKQITKELDKQVRSIDKRITELRHNGDRSAEQWVEVINSELRAQVMTLSRDVELLAHRVSEFAAATPVTRRAAGTPAAKQEPKPQAAKPPAAKRPAAKRPAGKRPAAPSAAAKRGPTKRAATKSPTTKRPAAKRSTTARAASEASN